MWIAFRSLVKSAQTTHPLWPSACYRVSKYNLHPNWKNICPACTYRPLQQSGTAVTTWISSCDDQFKAAAKTGMSKSCFNEINERTANQEGMGLIGPDSHYSVKLSQKRAVKRQRRRRQVQVGRGIKKARRAKKRNQKTRAVHRRRGGRRRRKQ